MEMILPKFEFTNLFFRKIQSIVVIDFSSGLKIINLTLGQDLVITGLQSLELSENKKDEFIIAALRNFAKKYNIQHKNAILIPALSQVFIKPIHLPAVSEKELSEAIKWKIKDDLPFNLEKAIIDFEVIKKSAQADGTKFFDVICAAVSEEELRRQLNLLKEAGFTCLRVGLLPFGYARLMERYFPGEKNESFGVLEMTGNNCYLAIYKENKLFFLRELPITTNKLKESLAGALVSDKGRVQLISEEIDEVIFKSGIPTEELVYKNKIVSSQILALLRSSLDSLVQEIKLSLFYYDSQMQQGKVNKIYLTADAARIPNLDTFLAKELESNFSLLPLLDKIKFNKEVGLEDIRQLYPALALALDLDQGINLLPYEFRAEKIEKVQKFSLRWIALIIFLVLSVLYIFSKAGVSAYQKQLDNLTFQLNTLSEVKQTKNKIDAFSNFFTQTRSLEPPLGEILSKLSNIAPRDLFFNQLNLDCDTKNGTITAFIKGSHIGSNAILTKFVSDMDRTGYFKDTDISTVTKSNIGDIEVTNFAISFETK